MQIAQLTHFLPIKIEIANKTNMFSNLHKMTSKSFQINLEIGSHC